MPGWIRDLRLRSKVAPVADQGTHPLTAFIGTVRKYNKATLLGWRVLRFDSQHVRTGEAVQTVMEVLHRTNS